MYPRVRRLLQHRWCRGAIIPPETRVDPSGFPEAEFPVVCPGCNYLLQGLPDFCCPECGRPFDRGRLLVEQYLLMRVPLSTAARLARTGAWIGVALTCLLPIMMPILLLASADPFSATRYVLPFVGLVVVVAILSCLCLLVWGREQRHHMKGRKAQKTEVFAGLDWEDPVFKRAQRLRWLSLVFFCLAGLSLVLILAYDSRYHSASPVLTALLFAVPVVSLFKDLRAWGPRRKT